MPEGSTGHNVEEGYQQPTQTLQHEQGYESQRPATRSFNHLRIVP